MPKRRIDNRDFWTIRERCAAVLRDVREGSRVGAEGHLVLDDVTEGLIEALGLEGIGEERFRQDSGFYGDDAVVDDYGLPGKCAE